MKSQLQQTLGANRAGSVLAMLPVGRAVDVIENSAARIECLEVLRTQESGSCRQMVPPIMIQEGRYLVRLIQTLEEFEAALRLRFEVFNLELGEGLEQSFATGIDQDKFDQSCQHLIVLELSTSKVVGTYRLQTGEMAAAAEGFYSAEEFDLTRLPTGVLESSVELGRACIDKAHRSTQVLFLLWKGVAAYVAQNHKRHLFGCCSLTSQDLEEGYRVFRFLAENDHLHPDFHVFPKPGFECEVAVREVEVAEGAAIPKLFRAYLRLGAKVCGPPAVDRLFGTIDFFVLFDVDAMDRKIHGMFFGA